MNTIRGAASKTVQVPDLGRPPLLKRDTFEDILADAEVPITLQRWVWFANIATSTPIPRPVKHPVERTPHFGTSQVPSLNQGLFRHPEPQKYLFQEGFNHSLHVAATEFQKLRKPK